MFTRKPQLALLALFIPLTLGAPLGAAGAEEAASDAIDLEALNKEHGTQILIDAATVERLPGVPVQEIGRVAVRGFSEPAAVFTPTAETGPQLHIGPGRAD